MARTAPPPLPGVSQNPSVAFGSTRPRNIDLTRPLVNPLPTNPRPRSEIFFGGYSPMVQVSSATYSKDDINYHHNNNQKNFTNRQQQQSPIIATTPTTPMMKQSMSTSFIQPNSNSNNSNPNVSSYRAVRRHDPELVPVMQKYLFRDFALPTSTTSSGIQSGNMRKENSLMTASMTSTKSYQAGSGLSSSTYRTPFGAGLGSRPKKSYSMNRLDQLAQPRRRVEPRGLF